MHQLYDRFKPLRQIVYAGVGFLLCANAFALVQGIDRAQVPHPMERVAHYLKEKGYRGGYGEYWHAYATTFLTNEDVILEPIWSNYLPYYRSRVNRLSEMVYLDSRPYKGPLNGREGLPGEHMNFGHHLYVIQSKDLVGTVDVFVLKRLM